MRGLRLLVGAAALTTLLTGTAHADPSPGPSAQPSTQARLADAKDRAKQLATQVDDLQRKAEVATEAFDDASATLDLTVEQTVAARAAVRDTAAAAVRARADAVDRARAIYESGGTAVQLAAAISSSTDVADLSTRLAVVKSISATAQEQTEAAKKAVDDADAAQKTLTSLLADQQRLATTAEQKKQDVEQLLADAQTAREQADGDVQQLADQLAQEQEEARQAAFRAQLEAAGGYAVPAGTTASFAELASRPDGVPATPLAAAAFAAIQKYLGQPYVWGGTGPVGYDCSGLVGQAFADAGVIIPRVGHLQYEAGSHPSLADLRAGDLVFWADGDDYTSIEHVAMYAGSGMMVSTNHTGDVARLQPVWGTRVFGFTRVDAVTAAAVPGGRWAPGQRGA